MNARAPKYLLYGLSATPALLRHLTAGLTEAQLDGRPDPDRFTIREVVAHMADWEAVCAERLHRTVTEESPELPDWDEDQAAIDGQYDQSDLAEQLALFTARRTALVAFLTARAPEDWERTSCRAGSPSNLLGLAAIQLGHDGYHLEQLVAYREQFEAACVLGA